MRLTSFQAEIQKVELKLIYHINLHSLTVSHNIIVTLKKTILSRELFEFDVFNQSCDENLNNQEHFSRRRVCMCVYFSIMLSHLLLEIIL